MFLRSILYPSLVACAIGAPLLYSSSTPSKGLNQGGQPYQANATAPANSRSPWQNVTAQPLPPVASRQPFTTASSASKARPMQVQSQNAPLGELNPQAMLGQGTISQNPAQSALPPQSVYGQIHKVGAMQLPRGTTVAPSMIVAGPVNSNGMIVANGTSLDVNGVGTNLTPDFGATQTLVFPGDANGPDLTATPTDFVPVANLAEIIRFDVFPNWVKSRWQRVSTNPGAAGLHGLRVALVTGTNSWDLHGSLTYYFDVNQRCQRITFRGWTGDSSRLVSLMTQQYGLRAQPTHWAGCYASEANGAVKSGLLMKHPAIITRENPVQQIAMTMELNHPQGSFRASDEFVRKLRFALQGAAGGFQ